MEYQPAAMTAQPRLTVRRVEQVRQPPLVHSSTAVLLHDGLIHAPSASWVLENLVCCEQLEPEPAPQVKNDIDDWALAQFADAFLA